MKDTLHVAIALWVPILVVVVVATICVPLYALGLTLKHAGNGIVTLGTWLQATLEDIAGRVWD